MTDRARIQTPVQVQPFVDILGIEGAVEFLLAFGGAELVLPKHPTPRNRVVQLIGLDRTQLLTVAIEHLPARIPTAKPWIAKVLAARQPKGLSVAEIARMLHMTDVTVRRYLKDDPAATPLAKLQLDLFDTP